MSDTLLIELLPSQWLLLKDYANYGISAEYASGFIDYEDVEELQALISSIELQRKALNL